MTAPVAVYRVDDLRRALGIKRKTGTYPALQGWSLNGVPIKTVILKRYNCVEYYGNRGEIVGVFDNNTAPLDD
jgi:hypothetical protein